MQDIVRSHCYKLLSTVVMPCMVSMHVMVARLQQVIVTNNKITFA